MKKRKVKVNIKIKFYKYLLGFFCLTFVILAVIVGVRQYKIYAYNKNALNVYETFMSLAEIEQSDVEYEKGDLRMGDYKVIGTIKIASIGIEYPILDRTTMDSLSLSITKLSGPGLNELGNVSIAGHHSVRGGLFTKLSLVKKGDIIEITDKKNRTIKYQVYKIYNVTPDNLDPVRTTDESVREITLISCIQRGKKRVIVKAIEVQE